MVNIDTYIIEKLHISKKMKSGGKIGVITDFISKDHPEMAAAVEEYMIDNDFTNFTVYVTTQSMYDTCESLKNEVDLIEDSVLCNKLFGKFDVNKDNIYAKFDDEQLMHIENVWAKTWSEKDFINVWAYQWKDKPRINIFLVKENAIDY